MTPESGRNPLKEKLFIIIFESDTPAGKRFDVFLLWAIGLSLLAVMLESVEDIRKQYGMALLIVEFFFTFLFTIEYILRLYCVQRPINYAGSFYGIVDLLAILPTYLSLIIAGSHILIVIRILRLLRVFRVLKLIHFMAEAEVLKKALIASVNKIAVFLFAVLTILIIVASAVYVIEGPENGFTSIPVSLYWAIVTLTTVGYGDIVPVTFFGRALANLIMIIGYGLIAVPTGIVSVELAEATKGSPKKKKCEVCQSEGHHHSAKYCKDCGEKL